MVVSGNSLSAGPASFGRDVFDCSALGKCKGRMQGHAL